jgi:integrase
MAKNLFRRGQVWWARLWLNGQEIRRSLQTADEATARSRLKDWQAELSRIRWSGQARPSYQEAVIHWTETYLQGKNVKPSTVQRYLVSARALHEHFAPLWLDQLTRSQITGFIAMRRKAGATNATIRRDLTALSSILDAAAAAGWCEDNPARAYNRKLVKEKREPIEPPEWAAIETVLAACPTPFANLIRFAALTGCRQEEVAGLEWRNVSLAKGTVTLLRTKTSRPRTIRLATPGGDATGTITGTVRHLTCHYVFWRADGVRYSQPSTLFWSLMGRVRRAHSEFPAFRFHDLRHAFAVRWIDAGGDVYELSRHLGHSSVTTTERFYLRWIEARDRTETGTAGTVTDRARTR